MKVRDITPNSNINLRVRVCSQEKERTVYKNHTYPLRVCEFKVGDDTGDVMLSMFNDDIDSLASAVGKVIDISNGWSKKWQGKIQLSLGSRGTWNVVNDKAFPSIQSILQGVSSLTPTNITSTNKSTSSPKAMKIQNLAPNLNANIKVRVCSQAEERMITKNNRAPLRVCNFTVGDETGHLNLTLFNDEIDRLSSFIGSVIEIKDGWVKDWQGDLQLSLGRSGAWEPIKDKKFPTVNQIMPSASNQSTAPTPGSVYRDILEYTPGEPVKVKVSQIVPNMNISTTVRVCEMKNIKYLNQKDGKNLRVRDFLVGDETGMISLAAFNEEIDELGKMLGKVVQLENCWTKFWNKSLQISKGHNGSWSVVNQKDFPSQSELLENYKKNQLELIEELAYGMVYYSSIKGIRFQESGKMIYRQEAMTELELNPEPENPYDNKAVGIWLDGKQMGYIPRTQNKAIFKALTEGKPEIKCYLGIFIPSVNTGYNLPQHVKDMPVTISTHTQQLQWRPVILFPEDMMAF